jgi:hypothetical protein
MVLLVVSPPEQVIQQGFIFSPGSWSQKLILEADENTLLDSVLLIKISNEVSNSHLDPEV